MGFLGGVCGIDMVVDLGFVGFVVEIVGVGFG